jgi:predicted Zn-dependent protease
MSARFHQLIVLFCAPVVLSFSAADAQQPAPAGTAAAPSPALTSTVDASKQMMADAIKKMNANDADGALADLTQALKLNPNSTGAYVLRASIYCQKKQWALAEDDFNAARKIAPNNTVLKFNLVEIKFMQKQYDVARPGFAALTNDPDMGDFAQYKVFLCDLFGGHEEQAKKELDVFDAAMGNPSYYFANAAWSLVHKNIEDARGWLVSASRIYPPQKNAYYAQSLRDLGYLPIPAPGDVVTPPAPSGASTPSQ